MIVTRRSVRISRAELDELLDHRNRLIESNEVLSDDVRELQLDLSAMAAKVRSLTAQLAAERERLSYPWERPPVPVPPAQAPLPLIFHHGPDCLGHPPETYVDGEDCPHADPCPCPNLAGDCDGLHPGADLSRRLAAGDPAAWGMDRNEPGKILDGAGWLRGINQVMGQTPRTGHSPEDYEPFGYGTADAIEDVIDRNRRLSE
jgi:hypothetical protein